MSLAFGQTIEKSQSIMIYDIKPTVAPCTFCSERAFVRADNTEYWWDGDSWEKWHNGNSYLTTLVQDSIIVTTRFGVEVDRDTVRVSGGGGGDPTTSLPADSVFVTDAGGYYTTDNVEGNLQEGAVERLVLDGLIGDLVTLSGVPVSSTDLGTFTGTIIPDNQTNKAAFQALETNAQSLTDSKLDSLTFSPATDTTYTVVRQYAAGVVAQLDTIYFPAGGGGGGGLTLAQMNDSLSLYRRKLSTLIEVSADGNADYETITEAITAANSLDGSVGILVHPGVYNESIPAISRDSTYLWSTVPQAAHLVDNSLSVVVLSGKDQGFQGFYILSDVNKNNTETIRLIGTGTTIFSNNIIDHNQKFTKRSINCTNATAIIVQNTFFNMSNGAGTNGGVQATGGTFINNVIEGEGGSGYAYVGVTGGTFVSNKTKGLVAFVSGGSFENESYSGSSTVTGAATFTRCSFESSSNGTTSLNITGTGAVFKSCTITQEFSGASGVGYALRLGGSTTTTFYNCQIAHRDTPASGSTNYALANTSGVAATVEFVNTTLVGPVDWTNITVTQEPLQYGNLYEQVVLSDRFTNDRNFDDYGINVDGGGLFVPSDVALTGTEGLFFAHNASNHFKGHDGTSLYRFPKYSDVAATDGQIAVYNSASDRWVPSTVSTLLNTQTNYQIDVSETEAGTNFRTVYGGDSEAAVGITQDGSDAAIVQLSVYNSSTDLKSLLTLSEGEASLEGAVARLKGTDVVVNSNLSDITMIALGAALKQTGFAIDDTSAIRVVATTAPNFAGIQYPSSAVREKFTDLSLTDKGYVLAQIAAASLLDGSGFVPDNTDLLTSDGAGVTFGPDFVNLQGAEIQINGTAIRTRDTIVVPIYDQYDAAPTADNDYRGWRTPALLNGDRIIGIQYSFDTAGSGDVLIQLGNGTVNIGGATIPTAGYVDVSANRVLVAGEKWTPDIASISGTGHLGLMVNLIIEKS